MDTGAEVNVIRQGIIPQELLSLAEVPIMLSAADASALQGGKWGVSGLANLMGNESEAKTPINMQCPIHFYEANIATEAILSYDWLGQHDFRVVPRRHGLRFRDDTCRIWIPGIPASHGRLSAVKRQGIRAFVLEKDASVPRIPTADPVPPAGPARTRQGNAASVAPISSRKTPIHPVPKRIPRLLDLFSGTGSVGNIFLARGYEVISVDNHPPFKPTHLVDVTRWDYQSLYPEGYFDVIFASPPCTEYSTAMTMRPRRFDIADVLVVHALEIIRYFNPKVWLLENPRGGHLKDRSFMSDLPFVDVDYCQFSDWGYQKPTRIWGSSYLGKLQPRRCDWRSCPI